MLLCVRSASSPHAAQGKGAAQAAAPVRMVAGNYNPAWSKLRGSRLLAMAMFTKQVCISDGHRLSSCPKARGQSIGALIKQPEKARWRREALSKVFTIAVSLGRGQQTARARFSDRAARHCSFCTCYEAIARSPPAQLRRSTSCATSSLGSTPTDTTMTGSAI